VIFQLTTLDETGSTNDEVAKAARVGAPEGTAVFARQQTAGRGRQGRNWQSLPGNVFFSMLLRPPQEKSATIGQLAFVVGLAVGEALGSYGVSWQLKWPNDVFINSQKIAGILLESEPGWVVAGIGINVQHTPPATDRPITSLRQEGHETTPEAVIAVLMQRFEYWYALWQQQGFMPVREEWLKHAYNIGGAVKVALANGQFAEGRFTSLDKDGALLIANQNGEEQRILAGDVFFA